MPDIVPTVVVKAEPQSNTTQAVASKREQAIAIMKDSVDKPEPVASAGEPPKAEVTTKKPASELASVARAHRKLLADQQAFKAQLAQAENDKADAELGRKIRAGEIGVLDTIDPEWYDKATKHTIAKMKPGAPEVLIDGVRGEIAKLREELSAIKNPPPPPPPDPARLKEVEKQFSSTIAESVAANPSYTLLAKESPADVENEVLEYCKRVTAERGKPINTWEDARALIDEATMKLEAALRAQENLTSDAAKSKTESGTTKSGGSSGQDQPQTQPRTQPKTMTASLNGGISVSSAPKTYAERRAQAMAELRRAREAE